MAVEIERKFLVVGDGWQAQTTRAEHIRDGLVATSDGHEVRVRISDGSGFVTIKDTAAAAARSEFEYAIPLSDAEELLARHCGARVVGKTRHHLDDSGFHWVVDVYDGLLAGVTVAEVELAADSPDPPLPAWIGTEVTRDPAYRKAALLQKALDARKATGSA